MPQTLDFSIQAPQALTSPREYPIQADCELLHLHCTSRRSLKVVLFFQADDIEDFHQGIKRRLHTDIDKLKEHCKSTTDSIKSSSIVRSSVVTPSEQFSARLSEWQQDITQERLLKKPVDLHGKILPQDNSGQDDSAARKLLEAHENYHAEKLPQAVAIVAKQALESKVGNRVVEKHKVGLGLTKGACLDCKACV